MNATMQMTTASSGLIGGGYWLNGEWVPNGEWQYPWPSYFVYPVTEPAFCQGRAHVFECDHMTTCKCGKVTRANPDKLDK